MTLAIEPARNGALLMLGTLCLLASVRSAPAAAQTGAYAPVGVDLLMRGRPEEGLLILHSGYRNSPYVDADAVVFLGASPDGREGDVLSMSVGLREPHGFGQVRLGRFILSTGAIRPVQIDGASVLGRAPSGTTLEAFGGLPVVPSFGPRPFDWLAGARAAQFLLDQRIGAGVSYLERRDGGELANRELGADLALAPADWLGVNAIGAFDLVHEGLAEARVAANAHEERSHVELFASRRVASRLLPATSLFSVISSAATAELGSDVLWNAFPRLDLGASAALLGLDARRGYRVAARSTLRLADEGAGQLGVEGLRQQLGRDGYSGGSVRVQLPIGLRLLAHASLELVAADHPADKGALFPWARVGVSYTLGPAWTLAAAIGARATPQYTSDVYALVRVGYNALVTP